MVRVGVHLLLLLLLLFIDFTATEGARPKSPSVIKVTLKRCTGRKPGKHTGACGYTCNRRTGRWVEKACSCGFCSPAEPAPFQVLCELGELLIYAERCDGNVDCDDGSDEESCPPVTSPTKTVSGKRCMFPFTYKDQLFTNCTTFNSENGKPWCRTEESKLEDCTGVDTLTVSGKRCKFPFTYKGKRFNNCTKFKTANGKAWCLNEDDELEDCRFLNF